MFNKIALAEIISHSSLGVNESELTRSIHVNTTTGRYLPIRWVRTSHATKICSMHLRNFAFFYSLHRHFLWKRKPGIDKNYLLLVT